MLPTPTTSRKILALPLIVLCLFAGAKRVASTSPSSGEANTKISRLGPIRLWPRSKGVSSSSSRRPAFTWQASVDRRAGKAYSSEFSNLPAQSKLGKAVADIANDSDIMELACELFGAYPTWLCRFTNTLGLLRAVPAEKGRRRGGYQIRSRLFGINIISFGVPHCRHITFHDKNNNDNNNKEEGKETEESSCRAGRSTGSDCTVVLPITGGLLSLPAGPSSRRGDDRGSMIFTLRTTRSRQDGPAEYVDEDSQRTKTTTTTAVQSSILTAITGYRPRLCGNAPINPLSAGFYLGTQSIVHGYVMWRFHRRCRGCDWK